MTLTPPTSAVELVGIGPLEKKREEIIVWLLLDRLHARWKEFIAPESNWRCVSGDTKIMLLKNKTLVRWWCQHHNIQVHPKMSSALIRGNSSNRRRWTHYIYQVLRARSERERRNSRISFEPVQHNLPRPNPPPSGGGDPENKKIDTPYLTTS